LKQILYSSESLTLKKQIAIHEFPFLVPSFYKIWAGEKQYQLPDSYNSLG